MTIFDNIMNAVGSDISRPEVEPADEEKHLQRARRVYFSFWLIAESAFFVKSRLCRGGDGESRQSPFVFASGIAAGASCV
jgi:hypothetical protein